MRILFVAPRFWPAVGGMESFLRHVTTALARRHEVTVLAQGLDSGHRGRLADSLLPPARFEAFAHDEVQVLPLRLDGARRVLLAPLALQVVPGLRRYAYGAARLPAARLYARVVGPRIAAAAASADIVHMWGGGLLGAAAIRAARTTGAPVAITPFAHRGQWGDEPAAAVTYRSADRVLALLEEDAAVYRELGVPAERIEVCGVCSPGVAAGGGAALRSRLGIEGPLVLFLGVRRPYKGFDLLLEAAPLVAGSRPDVSFAFLGPGPALPPSDGRILDIGEVGEDERAAWLEAADLLCLPSQGEIFPVTILEGWSVGTPVLTSDLPTLRELVGLTGGGATAERRPDALAEAIVSLLTDPAALRMMGESGRRLWQERFTVEAVAAAHERVYERLLGREVACVA